MSTSAPDAAASPVLARHAADHDFLVAQTAAGRWELDGNGTPRLGELYLSPATAAPGETGWVLCAGGEPLYPFDIPPPDPDGYDLDVLGARLAPLGYFLPVDGLGVWLAGAQEEAADAFEAMAAESALIGRTAAELLVEVDEEPDWVVPGVVARGWALKLGGREKGGKGTFVFYLLSRVELGEETVFGPCPRPTSSLILTEEPGDSVREKIEAFGMRRSRVVYGWELAGLEWPEKVCRLAQAAVDGGHGILFVDNVSRSARVQDENGPEMARAVELLQDACRATGLTLVVDHHHKKGQDAIENKSRGGTGLPGAVDVNVEMEKPGGPGSRARRLTSNGRLRANNWVLAIELSEDGTDYAVVEDHTSPTTSADDKLATDTMLLNAHGPQTVKSFKELLGPTVSKSTARRRLVALQRAGRATVSQSELTATGGRPGDVWTAVAGGEEAE